MKKLITIFIAVVASTSLVSCFDKSKPNYVFMDEMYNDQSYSTYGEYAIFPNQQQAMKPAAGTIHRGWMPYEYEDSNEGLADARANLKNPMPVTQANLDAGKKMFSINCAVCHGDKGDGQGILPTREKFLGIPSFADEGRDITSGSIYHVMMYGLNSMGSYAPQTSEQERWQIVMYVENLRAALKGTDPLPFDTIPMTKLEPAESVSVVEAEKINTSVISE